MSRQREKNLVKNTFILSIGTFLPKVFTFIVTPLLTGGLTKAEYGQYDLIVTLASLLLPAVTLQIASAAFRFLIDAREKNSDKESIITNIYAFVLLVTILTSFVFYIVFKDLFGSSGLLVCIYFAVYMLLQTSQQIMRGLGNNKLYSIGAVLGSFLNMLLLLVLIGGYLFPSMGLSGVVLSLILSELFATIYLFITGRLFSFIRARAISTLRIKELVSYSWPMVPNNLSGWILRLSDRLVITYFLGIEANALYAVANKFPALISSLQGVLIYAWQENASLASKDKDKTQYYTKMCNDIFDLLFGFVAIIIAATPILWRILIRGDYGESYFQLPVLYIGIMFSCMASIVGGIYIAFKKTVNVGITTSIAAAINLIIDFGFVNIIGIWAGSISTMVSYMVLLVYRMINIQQFQKIDFNYKRIVLGLLLLTIMTLLNLPKSISCDIINAMLAVFSLVFFCKSYILLVSKKILRKQK